MTPKIEVGTNGILNRLLARSVEAVRDAARFGHSAEPITRVKPITQRKLRFGMSALKDYSRTRKFKPFERQHAHGWMEWYRNHPRAMKREARAANAAKRFDRKKLERQQVGTFGEVA